MVALFRARKSEELGGWNMMSAPIPSIRLPVSFEIPFVKPTTTKISVTSKATASTLTIVRTGLAQRPAKMICLFIFLIAAPYSLEVSRYRAHASRGLAFAAAHD